ncbi:MAG: transposase [Myxococcaceae bacterium]|nr:transposase [Myxococcaceae bacterium]
MKPGLFGKRDFNINVRDGTFTCPAGVVEPSEPRAVVHSAPEDCGPCRLRPQCTHAGTGRGRTVTMGDDEPLQERLRGGLQTRAGRAKFCERVGVEHRLAHLANRPSPKARYWWTRHNLFDLRRLATVQNLEVVARHLRDQAATS